MLYNNITELIGNTPLVKIDPSVHGLPNVHLYAKLEYYNPFGSVKDRIAWGIIKDDLKNIQKDKQIILEMSSGNTAKALQVLASVHDVPFKTITNRIKVDEVKEILQALGTDIQELPGKSDCHDPNDPNDPLVYVNREIKEQKGKVYFTAQYTNKKNIQTHYDTTGQELLNDMPKIDYFFGSIGTSGSTRGTSDRLKEVCPDLQTIGIVATRDDYIPGIRNKDEVLEVGLFEPDYYDSILEVDPDTAINAQLELVRRCGILCGPTSGAVYAAVKKHLAKHSGNRELHVAFIVCDRMEWYMSYIKERMPELFGLQANPSIFDDIQSEEVYGAPELSAKEAKKLIDKKECIIIDIRNNQGYQVAHIEQSLNIPEDILTSMLNKNIKFCPGKPILVVCPAGNRSKKFVAAMNKQGYQAYSLAQGILAWQDAKFPTHSHLIKCDN